MSREIVATCRYLYTHQNQNQNHLKKMSTLLVCSTPGTVKNTDENEVIETAQSHHKDIENKPAESSHEDIENSDDIREVIVISDDNCKIIEISDNEVTEDIDNGSMGTEDRASNHTSAVTFKQKLEKDPLILCPRSIGTNICTLCTVTSTPEGKTLKCHCGDILKLVGGRVSSAKAHWKSGVCYHHSLFAND